MKSNHTHTAKKGHYPDRNKMTKVRKDLLIELLNEAANDKEWTIIVDSNPELHNSVTFIIKRAYYDAMFDTLIVVDVSPK